ncbi:hypothetical protein K491DRAFT_167860 [Lophiostoma macrostomum CBS 122681]|uniref:Inner centromere protein ARK-binding domain-containing protein n=1 Tax=Lophiostoma macrostomum CBS 122681 TaxID=1314788 RepID=A0A6A6SPQ9_9PLEO|nr:hypothetical protein K491DRAFT_167860 [Lophiostoma macrostomum CBS 122681]
MAARTRAPAIGTAQWAIEERSQANEAILQEIEDFGFSVRNELDWLNEHMHDIFAQNGQTNLDVFKTPGKLRGKTPRTARKKNAEPRQPLGDIFTANAQHRPSPAQQSLKSNLQKSAHKPRFQVAEDVENVAPVRSPAVRSPVPPPLFSSAFAQGKENQTSPHRATPILEEAPVVRQGLGTSTVPVQFSPKPSTQDTAIDSQEDTQVFTQESTQSTQPTQPTQSFRLSIHASEDERRDTGESFVSAKEAFGSKNASKENLHDDFEADAMDVDDRPDTTESNAQDTVIRHEASSEHEDATAIHHEVPKAMQEARTFSEQYSISVETQDALDTANSRALAPEPKTFLDIVPDTYIPSDPVNQHDDTVVHHDVEDHMDVDDEDVRSPSDNSSPVKAPIRKSSLTFAPLPGREPLLAKKSMGNRVSRTSHVDPSKARNSQMGRFTGGKSLGGSQYTQMIDTHDDDMDMDVDQQRPGLRREESETTKLHNSTSTKSLKERLNMLNQRNEPPKRISQSVMASQSSQSQATASQGSQPVQPPQPISQPSQPAHPAQPLYPQLVSAVQNNAHEEEDDDDDWISPIRTTAPAPSAARPVLSKSYSADTQPLPKEAILAKHISVSNPDLAAVVESTTPVGSPAGKKNMDGHLSASKAKLYSAFRLAKEKIIGSSATSAQAKLDALAESSARPKLQAQLSSDDVFSPKRNDKPATGLFSHLRSPSKESVKSGKSTKIAAMPGSPVKEDSRRTRSSSERERQREREAQEKEVKQKQRTEERFKEMREKEQSKAAAHYQKTKAATKTPVAVASQNSIKQGLPTANKTPVAQASQPRPGPTRTNTQPRPQDPDSSDEMPPPPPPKSLLPTGTGHKLREPKRLAKAPSKEAIPKGKPQKIQVNLHRFGQAPPPKSSLSTAPKAAPPVVAAPKPAAPAPRPASAATMKPIPAPKFTPAAPKPAPRMGRPQPPKAAEKPKPALAPSRADLGASRPVSRMQTVQDATRINVPPVNPAKPPPKRPFQPEHDEPLHRPAKRPSQQAKSKPVTPAHAQFAQGKIPFAESSQSAAQQPTIQYQNGEDIKLPDIMTDSEDEDSGDDFEQPSWVNTPNLREMLTQQQLVDPEQVFGPIAPLNMEQIFPNKERHKRFRDRTSSAYWAHDQVTEEERRKEREARERLVRDGAWTYNPSPRPAQ